MKQIEQEFYSIISRLHRQGILKHLTLIGSWAFKIYFASIYKKDFILATKDIDFSIKRPKDPFPPVNIHQILMESGYKAQMNMFINAEKYVPQETSDNQLDIEFLCPPGRHIQEPYRIKELYIKVTPLRFQDILLSKQITVEYREIEIRLPDPFIWAAHKIAISQERMGQNKIVKSAKDLSLASLLVREIGKDPFYQQAKNNFKGKFLKSFEKGWLELLKGYMD